jgi:hypothetical protein
MTLRWKKDSASTEKFENLRMAQGKIPRFFGWEKFKVKPCK